MSVSQKRFVIAGAGRQGVAIAAWLLDRLPGARVCFADADEGRVRGAVAAQRDGDRVEGHRIDLPSDTPALRRLLADADVLVSAVPFFFNEALARLAIDTGSSFVDLGGNTETVRAVLRLAEPARKSGVVLVPDCGIAPGAANVLAEYFRERPGLRSIRIFCGGLPCEPVGVLKYQALFSVWGLINEYFEPVEVARGGRVVRLEGLSEPEPLTEVPLPGDFEAFATSGGASVAPEMYAARGIDYEYKTVRYRGHRDVFRAMWELGFFETRPWSVPSPAGPVSIVPREVSATLIDAHLPREGPDVLFLRIDALSAEGRIGRIELVDRADGRFSAMARTTGFSTGVVAAVAAGALGEAPAAGAYVPFQIIPPELMIDELRRCGMQIAIMDGGR